MWNRIFSAPETGDSASTVQQDEEPKTSGGFLEQIEQQNLVIEQMKSLLRDNETQFKEKDDKLSELSAKFQKFQIQSKAKIANLSKQLKENPPKKDEGEFDDTSSSDSTESSTRGRVILLRKQLETTKQQLDKRDNENKEIARRFEQRIKDLENELDQKNKMFMSFQESQIEESPGDSSGSIIVQDSSAQEMYAQIVYKDSKIVDLNNQILELERRILDLQEHIKEKNEVLQSRNLAVHLMSADMSRKGKSVVDELEETRQQMKLMQSNFADVETEWKANFDALNSQLEDMKREISQKEVLLSNSDANLKNVEAVRYELATKNAELQKKIVLVEEKAKKHSESHQKQVNEELQHLQKLLEEEKSHSAELQRALKNSASESESKVLKARVKERTKLKALERELASLKSLQSEEQKPEKVMQLEQQVAILEEEKGTLQLRLIEVDEQVALHDELKSKVSEQQQLLDDKENQIILIEEKVVNLEETNNSISAKLKELEMLDSQLKQDYDETNNHNLLLGKNNQELLQFKEELEKNVILLKEENKELITENESLAGTVSLSKDENVSINLKIIELEEIQERYEKHIAELQKQISEMESKMKTPTERQTRKDIKKLQTTCQELKNMVQSTEAAKKASEKEVELLRKQVDELSAALESNGNEKSSLQNELSTLQTNFNETSALLKDKQQECVDLNTSKTALESELCGIISLTNCENISNFHQVWGNFMQELEKYKGNYESVSANSKILQENLKKQNEEFNIRVTEVQQLKAQLQQRQKENTELQEDIKKQVEKQKVLETSLNDTDNLRAEDQLKIQNYEDDIKYLNNEIQNKANSVVLLEDDNAALAKGIADLQKTVEMEHGKTESKVSSLLEQISDMESEVSRLNAEVAAKLDTEGKLQKDIAKMELELNNLVEAGRVKMEFLQNTCEEKDQMLFSLQERVTLLNANLQQNQKEFQVLLEKTKDRYEKELEEFGSDLKLKVVELGKVEEENLSLKQVLLTKDQCVKAMNDAIQGFQNEKKNSDLNISSLTEEMNATKQQILNLQDIISTSKSSASEKENLYAMLLNEKSDLQIENEKSAKEIETLKKLVDEMEAVKSELFNKNEELLVHNKDLQSAISEKDALKEEIEGLKQSYTDKTNEHDEFRQSCVTEIDTLKGELETLRQKNFDITAEFAACQLSSITAEENSRKEIDILGQSLSDKIKEFEELQLLRISENNSLLDNIKEVTENYTSKTLEFDAFRISSESDINKYVELVGDLKHKLQLAHKELNEKLVVFNHDLQNSLAEKDGLKEELYDLKQKYSAKSSEFDKFRQSSQLSGNKHSQVVHDLELKLQSTNDALELKEIELGNCVKELKLATDSSQNYGTERDVLTANLEERTVELKKNGSLVESLSKELESMKENLTKSSEDVQKSMNVVQKKNILLENSIEELGTQLAALKAKELALSEENAVQNSVHQKCRDLFKDSHCRESDQTLDEMISAQTEMCQQLLRFKKECCAVFLEIESSDLDLDNSSTENILSHINNIISGFQVEKANLLLKISELEETNAEILNTTSGLREINTELTEDRNISTAGLHCLSSRIVNIEEDNLKKFQYMSTKLEKLYHSLEMFALRKEEFQRLFISYKTHESILKERTENHRRELESLSQCSMEDRNMFAENIRLLNVELDNKNQQLEITNEQLNIHFQTISTLKNELKSSKEQNEQLRIGMRDNHDNYSNDVTNLKRRLMEAWSTVSTLKTEVADLKTMHESLLNLYQDDFCTASAAVSNLVNEIEILNCASVRTFNENSLLKKQVEELNEQCEGFKQCNIQLENQVNDLQLQLSDVHSHLREESDSKEALCVQSSFLTEQIKSLKKNLEEVSIEKNNFEKTVEDYKAENEILKSFEVKFDEVKSFIANLSEEIKTAKNFNIETPMMAFDFVSTDEDFKVMLNEFSDDLFNILVLNSQLSQKLKNNNSKSLKLTNEITFADNLKPIESVTASSNVSENIEPVMVSPEAVKVTEEKLLKSSPVKDSESLSEDSSKGKSDKNLLRLKMLKSKIDKLNKELQEAHDMNADFKTKFANMQEKIEIIEREKSELCTYKDLKETEVEDLKFEIQKLEDLNTLSSSNYEKLCIELQELRRTCELKSQQVQDLQNYNRQLDSDLKDSNSLLSSLKTSHFDLRCKYDLLEKERKDLDLKLENMQYYANVAMSDNDTYQALIEKLKNAKASLEKDVQRITDDFSREIKDLHQSHKTELEEQCSVLKEQYVVQLAEHENKYDDLLDKYNELRTKTEDFKKVGGTILYNIATQKDDMETEELKIQLDDINKDLQSARDVIKNFHTTESIWKEEFMKMESHYKHVIHELQKQHARVLQEVPSNDDSFRHMREINGRLEAELKQALESLHRQSLRCEELNLEVSKLLEEKNSMKVRVNQQQQQLHQLHLEHRKEDVSLQRSSDSSSSNEVQIAIPVEENTAASNVHLLQAQQEIAALHQRLFESEKICKELRKANDALDGRLVVETQQRHVAEEELGYAQKQLLPQEKPKKDEYRLLLDDFDEPEMFVETNYSISRDVKSHAHKLQHWLRGRRLYLHKACQRKKYSELLYIFYICAVHIWLLFCIFGH